MSPTITIMVRLSVKNYSYWRSCSYIAVAEWHQQLNSAVHLSNHQQSSCVLICPAVQWKNLIGMYSCTIIKLPSACMPIAVFSLLSVYRLTCSGWVGLRVIFVLAGRSGMRHPWMLISFSIYQCKMKKMKYNIKLMCSCTDQLWHTSWYVLVVTVARNP